MFGAWRKISAEAVEGSLAPVDGAPARQPHPDPDALSEMIAGESCLTITSGRDRPIYSGLILRGSPLVWYGVRNDHQDFGGVRSDSCWKIQGRNRGFVFVLRGALEVVAR